MVSAKLLTERKKNHSQSVAGCNSLVRFILFWQNTFSTKFVKEVPSTPKSLVKKCFTYLFICLAFNTYYPHILTAKH